ncbi:MAG: sugar ABC transporter permease [Arachnia propionica]|uniref:carbohydrate ABC transporter permease n=1 Tax=Arachnia propionica TaxID=1750 RepID=UPI00270F71A8|nr:sugar ABC transporter permease [Arachnia propionica]
MMSTPTQEVTKVTVSPQAKRAASPANWPRAGVGLLGMVLIGWFVGNAFLALAYYPEWFSVGPPVVNKIIQALLAMVFGIGGSLLFFASMNLFINGLPGRLSQFLMPYAYVLPGYFTIGLVLLYPTIQTVNYSFANADSTAYQEPWFGNFQAVLSSDEFLRTIWNNVLWLLLVPASTVVIGLIVAVLADRLSPRGEKLSKALIFLPMAISFVGAATIWQFIYDYQSGDKQIGLLNALVATLGGQPEPWIQHEGGALNSLLLMVIVVWLQVGYAMVLLSTAIKNVPEDTLEAARIDGASELKIFFQIVIPQMKGTMITVFVTVFIMVMKIFDIVYVMTNGNYKTNVIANMFFQELFVNQNAGKASAIVVLLLLAVIPVLIYQVRHFKREEQER